MSAQIEAVLNNPLGHSDADLEKLMKQIDGEDVEEVDEGEQPDESEADANEGDETGGASAAGKDEGEKAAQDREGEEGEEPADPSKAVVLTRDGKHTIPYQTLQNERQGRIAAEQRAQQLAQQLAELQRQAQETPAQREARNAPEASTVIDDEALASLREEAPELARLFDGLIGRLTVAEQRAMVAEQRVARREEAEVEDVVERAVSNNAKLLYARSAAPEVFNKIVEFDNFLRQSPDAAGLSLEKRLEKSVAMYEAVHGSIDVPGSAKPGRTVADVTPAPRRGPSTLSDLPGGSLPPRGEAESLMDMSAATLTQRLMGMSPKEQEDLLARLAL